jgi:hypothetical protein
VRKQKTLKILFFVAGVEDYHKLAQTQFLIQSSFGNLTSVPNTIFPCSLTILPMVHSGHRLIRHQSINPLTFRLIKHKKKFWKKSQAAGFV